MNELLPTSITKVHFMNMNELILDILNIYFKKFVDLWYQFCF